MRHCLMCGRDTDLLEERCPTCRGFLYEEYAPSEDRRTHWRRLMDERLEPGVYDRRRQPLEQRRAQAALRRGEE